MPPKIFYCLHNNISLGTGKSETGAHLAYIFANINKRDKHKCSVLYCGPSNKAVDVVLGMK